MHASAVFSHRSRMPWRAAIFLPPEQGKFRGAEVWRGSEHYATWQAAQDAAEAELRESKRFEFDGATYSLTCMAAAVAHDAELCAWLRTAELGDRFHECVRVR